MPRKIASLIHSMRPSQWPKNLVVFAAFFFSINERWTFEYPLVVLGIIVELITVYLIFCFLSGALYIINDIKDIEFDRNHPCKRFRPIADNKISKKLAIIFSGMVIISLIVVAYSINNFLSYCLIGYIILTLSYSFILKKVVILDVVVIAIGFVIRVVSGAIVADVPISIWLYLCTALGALVLGLGKRRVELILGGSNSVKYRSVFKFYSLKLIDRLIWVVSTSLIISYTFYTFTASNLPVNRFMLFTIPIMVFGVLRFLYLLNTGRVKLQPEDTFFRDKLLLTTGLIWIITSVTILYLYRV